MYTPFYEWTQARYLPSGEALEPSDLWDEVERAFIIEQDLIDSQDIHSGKKRQHSSCGPLGGQFRSGSDQRSGNTHSIRDSGSIGLLGGTDGQGNSGHTSGCHRCGGPHHVTECTQRIMCGFCRGNHLMSNCRKKNYLCYLCGVADHQARSCTQSGG